MTLDEAVEAAFTQFEAGRVAEAGAICVQILAACPTEHRAVRLLGAVQLKTGQLEAAEQSFRRAIELQPGQVEYYDNLCTVLNAMQRWSDLEQAARQLLQWSPRDHRGENSLGLALRHLGRLAESEAALRRALGTEPRSINSLNNLSGTLRALGRMTEAEQACRAAISLAPQVAASWLNLGTALHEQMRYEEAAAAFDAALERAPDMPLAWFNRGAVFEIFDQFTAAERCCRRALELQPSLLTALNNLGSALKSQGRLDEALDCFREALRQRPDYMVAHTNLLLTLQCQSGVDPQGLLAEHRAWNQRHAARFLPTTERPRAGSQGRVTMTAASPGADSSTQNSRPCFDQAGPAVIERRPLRVGFVSPDLGQHPVGRFLIAGFERIEPVRVTTICYSDRRTADPVTERFRQSASIWRETARLNDDQLAQQIRDDHVDLLIDLTGHTGQHRLLVFARRSAPVQATWIGYSGTTGMDAIDWLIADSTLVPDGAEHWYAERIARLPHAHITLDPLTFAPDVIDPPCVRCSAFDQSSDRRFVTFGSFNKLDKTNAVVLETWQRLLHAVPDSRLVLRHRGLDDPGIAERFRAAFASAGIAAERLELHGWTSHTELLSAWQGIDIALDTFPFSGGATSVDALWMGVPVVTLAGPLYASRQTASLLTAIGETSMIASTTDDYVARAAQLARDPDHVRRLRHLLRPALQASPLCDPVQFAESLTTLFENLARET